MSNQTRHLGALFVAAGGLGTLGSMPVFLLSAQAVYIQADLGFGLGQLGISVSVYFAAAALASFAANSAVDRLGLRVTTATAGLLAGLGGLGVGVVAWSWVSLTICMMVLGVAHAACQASGNLIVATVIPQHRRGLAFGVKQAAVPTAVMLAGLAVPTLLVQTSWRTAFIGTGAIGVALLLVGPWLSSSRSVTAGPRATLSQRRRPRDRPLIVTVFAVALAAAAVSAMAAFIAPWGVEVGIEPGAVGLLMAAGSGCNIVVRIFSGHRADGRQGRNLPVVATQMIVAAVCFAALSVAQSWVYAPAVLLAFAIGWSWPGLLQYAVVRIRRDTPGSAASLVQAGAFTGSAVGPAAFGAGVDLVGFETVWLISAAISACAAVLVLVARRLFILERSASMPTGDDMTPKWS